MSEAESYSVLWWIGKREEHILASPLETASLSPWTPSKIYTEYTRHMRSCRRDVTELRPVQMRYKNSLKTLDYKTCIP
jgi:hypothetical protein